MAHTGNIVRIWIIPIYSALLVSGGGSPASENFTSVIPVVFPIDTALHRLDESWHGFTHIPALCLSYSSSLRWEPSHRRTPSSLKVKEYSNHPPSAPDPIVFNLTTGEFTLERPIANSSFENSFLTFGLTIEVLHDNESCLDFQNITAIPVKRYLQIRTENNSPPRCFRRLDMELQREPSSEDATPLSLLKETSSELDGRILRKNEGPASQLIFNATTGAIYVNTTTSSAESEDGECSQQCSEILTCSYSQEGARVTEYVVVYFPPDHDPKRDGLPGSMELETVQLRIYRDASHLTKVHELRDVRAGALESFRADDQAYETVVAFEEAPRVFFVNDSALLRRIERDHLIYHVRLVNTQGTVELTMNVSLLGELHRCSSFESRDACEGSCGHGAPQGRCQWRQQSSEMAVSDSYSTCSPDLETCPDKECDRWERINGLCWQDCTEDDVRFGGWKNEATGVGIANAVGPCTCNEGGVCSCRNVRIFNNTEYPQPKTGDLSSFQSHDKPMCGTQCTIVISVLIPTIICISVLLAVAYRRRRGAVPLRSLSLGVKPGNLIELQSRLDSSSSYYVPEELIRWKKAARMAHEARWEFSRSKLIFGDMLGEGEYGRVMKAQALNIRGHTGYTPVAVKMMKRANFGICNFEPWLILAPYYFEDFPRYMYQKDSASSLEIQDFLSELELLKQVNHPNVIRLLGAVTLEGPFLLIVEFCEHGALRSFLRANRKRATVINEYNELREKHVVGVEIGDRELISYAWQICRGMDYLSCLKFVHRDLAARNILVTSEFVMKISDFGLSRDIYEGDTYVKQGKGKIPVKWMAVEVLYDNIYTSKSDVWSFGVLLWEMITMGATPYPGVTSERLYQILKEGYRMERPDGCTNELYDVMLRCWRENPTDRPTFAELSDIFEHLLTEHVVYLDFLSDANEEASEDEQDGHPHQ